MGARTAMETMRAATLRPQPRPRELRIPVPGEEIVLRARVEGAGPRSVLLLHNLCEDIDVWWERGWAQALARHRRVIAFDARGHGASTKPTEPFQYTAFSRVMDALAVIDVLDCQAVDVVGYAMGAWTAMQLAARMPGRIRSLVVGGTPATGQSLTLIRRALAAGLPAMLAEIERETGPLGEPLRRRFLANDVRALAAVCAEDRCDMIEELSSFDGRAMFYVGEHDPRRPAIESSARRLGWPLRIVPGRDHFDLGTSGDALSAVLDFLAG